MTHNEAATFTRTAAAMVAENTEPDVDLDTLAGLVSGADERMAG